MNNMNMKKYTIMLIMLILLTTTAFAVSIDSYSPSEYSIVNWFGFDLEYNVTTSEDYISTFVDDGSLAAWFSFSPDKSSDTIETGAWTVDNINGYNATLEGSTPESFISNTPGIYGNSLYWNFTSPSLTYKYRLDIDTDATDIYDLANNYSQDMSLCAIVKPENFDTAGGSQNGPGFVGFGDSSSTSNQQGIGIRHSLSGAASGQFYILDVNSGLVNNDAGTQSIPYDEWSLICGFRAEFNETHVMSYASAVGELEEYLGQENTVYNNVNIKYSDKTLLNGNFDRLYLGSKGASGGSIAPGQTNGYLDEIFVFNKILTTEEMNNIFKSYVTEFESSQNPGIDNFLTQQDYTIYAKDAHSDSYSTETITFNVSESDLAYVNDDGSLVSGEPFNVYNIPNTTITGKNGFDSYGFYELNDDLLVLISFDDDSVSPDTETVTSKFKDIDFVWSGVLPISVEFEDNARWGSGLNFTYDIPDASENYALSYGDSEAGDAIFDYINDYDNDFTMCGNIYPEPQTSSGHGQNGQGVVGFGTSRTSSAGWGIGSNFGSTSSGSGFDIHMLSVYGGTTNEVVKTGVIPYNQWLTVCGSRVEYNETHFRQSISVVQEDGTASQVLSSKIYSKTVPYAGGTYETWDRLRLGSQGMSGGSIAPGTTNGLLDDIIIIGRHLSIDEIKLLSNSTLTTVDESLADNLNVGDNEYKIYGFESENAYSIKSYNIYYTDDATLTIEYPYKPDLVDTQKNSCMVYQRDTETEGTGKVVVEVGGNITSVEYSFNGGDWTTAEVDTLSGTATFNFTGEVGWGNLSVRAGNLPNIVDTVNNVGIGDVFVASGQSNGVVLAATSSEVEEGNTLHCVWQGSPTCGSYTNGYWAVNNEDRLPTDGSRDVSQYSLFRLAQETNIPVGTIGADQCGTGIIGWQDEAKRENYELQVTQATNGTNKAAWHLHVGSTSDAARGDFDSADIDDHQSWIQAFHPNTIKTIYQVPNYQGTNKDSISNTRNVLETYYKTHENVFRGPSFGDVSMLWKGSYVDLHFTTVDQKTEFYTRWFNTISDAVLGTSLYTPAEVTNIAVDSEENIIKLTFDKPIQTANWNDPDMAIEGMPTGWLIKTDEYNLSDANITDYEIDDNVLYLMIDSPITSAMVVTYPDGASPWYNYDNDSNPYTDELMIYSTTGELASQIYNYDSISSFSYYSAPLEDSATDVKFIIFSAFGILAVIIIASAAVLIINIFNQGDFQAGELIGVAVMSIGLAIVLIIGYVIIELVSNGLYG
jgi:hypothetical protein